MIRNIEIDGKQFNLDLPDDATDAEIDEIVNSELGSTEPLESKPGLFSTIKETGSEIGTNLYNRGQKVLGDERDKKLTAIEQNVRLAGNVVGAINDVAGPIAKRAIDLEPLRDAVEYNFPNTYKKGVEIIGGVAKGYDEFRQKHPRIAGNVDAGANIIGAIPGAAAGKVAYKGAVGIAESTTEGTGKGLVAAANRIQNTKVKINAPEQRQGAKMENYAKYDVFGSAGKVQKQWLQKIDETAKELKAKIESTPDSPETRTNIIDALAEAENLALKNTRIDKIKLKKAFEDVSNEILETYKDTNGDINLLEAQLLKRDVGKRGDWLDHNGKMVANEDSSIKSKAYNALYDVLKRSIEDKGPEGIKELNKKLSEMIPMERAAGKRLLVESRKNPISLEDFIGGLAVAGNAASGNFLPAVVTGANVLSKSPNVAKLSSMTGKGLQSAATKDLFPSKSAMKYKNLYRTK